MYPWIPQEIISVPLEVLQIEIPIEIICYDSKERKIVLKTSMQIVKKQRVFTKIGSLIITTFQYKGRHPCMPPTAKSIIRKVHLEHSPAQIPYNKEDLLSLLQARVFLLKPGNPIRNFITEYKTPKTFRSQLTSADPRTKAKINRQQAAYLKRKREVWLQLREMERLRIFKEQLNQ